MNQNKIFRLDIDVRLRDIDGRKHVNNAVYFTYFEHGRMRFYNAALEQHSLDEIKFILASIKCDFIKPITLTDKPQVELWVQHIGTKSVTFGYRLVDRNNPDVVFATAESVQVCFDYRQNVSFMLPDDIRAGFSAFLGD